MDSPKKIARLLTKIPHLIRAGYLPPCRVVNDILKAGVYDAGMSGVVKWTPVELSETSYAKVVSELKRQCLGLLDDESPLEVKTYSDWHNWRLVKSVGNRGGELSYLLNERDELIKEMEKLKKCYGSTDEIVKINKDLMINDFKTHDILVRVHRDKGTFTSS